MRKIFTTILLACFATFALSACNKTPDQAEPVTEQAPEAAAVPTNPTDKAAWKNYLIQVVTANMQGVKSNHPYMYFVPGGEDDAEKADRTNQLNNVTSVVTRGVLPGNMMAFGGPDSKLTAQLITDAFKDVQAGAFKGVVVLFVGSSADFDAVKQALATSGAEARLVEAK